MNRPSSFIWLSWQKVWQKAGKLILASALSPLLSHCAVQHGRMEDIRDLDLTDIVHHDILDAVGVERIKPPTREYDPALKKYLDSFLEDAKVRGVTISSHLLDNLLVMKYVDKFKKINEHGVVAACNRFRLSKSTIEGRKVIKWSTIELLKAESADFIEDEEIRLRLLVYHELFHCLMGRGHLPAGSPTGIMNVTLAKADTGLYAANWQRMVDEMFANADQCPVVDE